MTDVRHLRALQAFDLAATQSNLSRAADLLGVTHGAVSRQIKQLEQYLGVSLLRRLPNGVEMTEAGAQLHVATREAFSALELGIQSLKRALHRRSVKISLSSSLAIKWLVPKLPAFRAEHPGIALYLDTDDDMVDFGQSDVDIALRYGIPNWGELHCERLKDEDLIVVGAPSLIGANVPPLTPKAIARLPLLHDEFNPGWEIWTETVGLERSRVTTADVRFCDSAVLITAAIDGQGAILARQVLIADDLAAGRLVRLDETTIPQDRALYFVCRTGDQARMPISLVRDWLVSVCRKQR